MLHQCFRIFFFFKAIFLVKLRRSIPRRTFHRTPFSRQFFLLQTEIPQHPVKRRLDKGTDFPFPVDDNAKHTCHDTSHRDHCPVTFQIIFYRITVFQCQDTGKINTHKIIFLCAQICRITQIIIFLQVFGFPDSTQDFLLCLGIYPHPFPLFPADAAHLLHQPVNVLSFTSGVRAHINPGHVRTFHERAYNSILLFGTVNDFIFIFFRQKRYGVKAPSSVFFVIGIRITHGDKMPYTPCNNDIFRFQISVPGRSVDFQGIGKFPCNTWFFCNK